MLETVEGIYEDGSIELQERPLGVKRARVLVTFLPEDLPKNEGQILQFGKYAGQAVFNEEDFRMAEWRGDDVWVSRQPR